MAQSIVTGGYGPKGSIAAIVTEGYLGSNLYALSSEILLLDKGKLLQQCDYIRISINELLLDGRMARILNNKNIAIMLG